MTTTIDPVWGSPEAAAIKPPSSIPKAARIILAAIGCFVAALIIGAAVFGDPADDAPSSSGGDVHATAGWTVNRVVDLEFDLRKNGGMSNAQADCTMRAIVGNVTWMKWRATSKAGQLATIRTAARNC